MRGQQKNREYWQKTWIRFKDGDLEAFGEIYKEYIDLMYDYGSKITQDKELVKDCIQDLFVDLYKYGKKLNTPTYLEYYFFKSLKRLIIKRIRADQRFADIQENNPPLFEVTFDLENKIIQTESENKRLKLLQEIIKNLDSKKRELLYLRFNSGLNYNEIGNIVGLKPDTVKKQIYRLIDSLSDDYGSKLIELFVFFYKK